MSAIDVLLEVAEIGVVMIPVIRASSASAKW
jgi:hypothetical protein